MLFRSSVVAEPEGEIAQLYRQMARTLAAKVAQQSTNLAPKFPTITISKRS